MNPRIILLGIFTAIGAAAGAGLARRRAPAVRRRELPSSVRVLAPRYSPQPPEGFRPLGELDVTADVERQVEALLGRSSYEPGTFVPFRSGGREHLAFVLLVEGEDGAPEQSAEVFVRDDRAPPAPPRDEPASGWRARAGETWRLHALSSAPVVAAGRLEDELRAALVTRGGSRLEDFQAEAAPEGSRLSFAVAYGRDEEIPAGRKTYGPIWIEILEAERVE